MGTALRLLGGKVMGWRVDLPGSDLQVRYDEGDSVRLAARDGGEPPDGWNLRSEGDGRVTVGRVPVAGETGPQWRLSAGRTLDHPVPHPEAVLALESFTLPPAYPADPSVFARLTRAGVLDHHTPFASSGAYLGVAPARPSPHLSDTGSGSRTAGPFRKRARLSAPVGSSAPDRPAPPAAADMSGGGRTRQSTRALLARLNSNKTELAWRLLIGPHPLHTLLGGGGDGKVWLPRFSVLEKIVEVEADWRLVPAGDEGFAVAVRQDRDIAHFHPNGLLSHWVTVLPGHGPRLRFDTPQGLPRLVGADGVSGLPGGVVSAEGSVLRVRQGEGEWTLDAQWAVRGYQRAAGSGPDPAQQLSQQLSTWSRNPWSRTPGEPALADWENSLETIKNARGITKQQDVARILGVSSANLTAWMGKPTEVFQWRVRIAAYLTSKEISKDIRNWRIETSTNHHFFHVVFSTGTTLTFGGGQVMGWRVDLPGSDLQVRYDEGGSVRLAARDGGGWPDGWDLRSGEDGRVTVVQVLADGETGPQWRLSAGRTLDHPAPHPEPVLALESFTLPPAYPADPGVFARLTRAGVLDHPAPHPEPVPAEAAPMAPDSDLPDTNFDMDFPDMGFDMDFPDMGFPDLEIPDTVTEDHAGPSYLDTLTWTDTGHAPRPSGPRYD